jgi:NAD(P)-dependent dehydrogenase (short-subunit alcohol dehydrogenase family)
VHPALIGASTAQQVDELFRTNMIGPVLLVNSVWPLLLAEADDSGRSTVVNISSMATIDPFPELFAYATSKAGLNIMVRSIHNQGGSRGVRAFAIAPGSVETQMLRAVVSEGVLPTERTLAPADVARVVGQCVQGVRDEFSGSVIVLTSP